MTQERERVYPPIRFDADGLRGKRARIIVEYPCDDQGYDAIFPAGTQEVIIADDTPSVYANLHVYVPGQRPGNRDDMQIVRVDQLSLVCDV